MFNISRISINAIGKVKKKWIREGINEYKKRILHMTDRTDLNINNIPNQMIDRYMKISDTVDIYNHKINYSSEDLFFNEMLKNNIEIIGIRFYIFKIYSYMASNIYYGLLLVITVVFLLYYFLNSKYKLR